MALRQLRFEGDKKKKKKCREVSEINDKILTLLEDMAQTMVKEEGVGLAAPQIGILKRVVTIDVGGGLLKLINPVLTYEEGEEIDEEGCLSVPGKTGEVKRPAKVRVKYTNEKNEEIEIEATGLLARALCHEIDHLNGILYIDRATKVR